MIQIHKSERNSLRTSEIIFKRKSILDADVLCRMSNMLLKCKSQFANTRFRPVPDKRCCPIVSLS